MLMLKLYVSGMTAHSRHIIDSLRRTFDAELEGAYELDVIDLRSAPELARREQILVTPTLVRVHPSPSRRVIGDLTDARGVLSRLRHRAPSRLQLS